MADMKKKTTRKSEKEIDELVIVQADDDSAWEKPVQASRSKSEAVSIPAGGCFARGIFRSVAPGAEPRTLD
jgi:hypothetical protein